MQNLIDQAVTNFNTDTSSGAQVTLNKNFQSGDFGITLTDAGPAISGTPDLVINGDMNPIKDSQGNYVKDSLGNLLTDGNQAINFNDTLYGSAGNDVINTGGGQNYVYGWRGGNDTINGGSGADYMYLGDGNNIAIGNGSSASTDGTADVFAAGNGNNQLYANGQVDVATAIAQQNALAPSNQKGDFFSVCFVGGRCEAANDFDWRVTA